MRTDVISFVKVEFEKNIFDFINELCTVKAEPAKIAVVKNL